MLNAFVCFSALTLRSNARGRERKGKLNCRVSRSTMWDANTSSRLSCDYTPREFERVGIGVSRRIGLTCNQRASYARESGLCEPEAVDTESVEREGSWDG